MSRLARDALADGIDGLAIDIFDAAAFAPVLAEAHARGVPVVAFNIDDGAGRAGNLSGIAQDFPAAGRALGGRIAGQIRPGSMVVLTTHDAGISALEQRRDGLKAALSGHDIRWIETITGHEAEAAARHVFDIPRMIGRHKAVLTSLGKERTEEAARTLADHLVESSDSNPQRLTGLGPLDLAQLCPYLDPA